MISSQVLQNAIDELRSITRIDLCVFDPEGRTVVSTFNGEDISKDMVCLFNDSAADSQVIQGYHFSRFLMIRLWNTFLWQEVPAKIPT